MAIIGIIGATGGTGTAVVDAALEGGHTVKALVRGADRLTASDGLHVIDGDARNFDAVARLIDDCEAVICTIGLAKGEGTSISEATAILCKALEHSGPNRLVVVTVNGINESKATAGFFGKVIIPVMLKGRFADRARQEDVIRATSLDYTIVRPSRLVDQPATAKVASGTELKTSMSSRIGRADLAGFLISTALSDAYVRQAVTVTEAK